VSGYKETEWCNDRLEDDTYSQSKFTLDIIFILLRFSQSLSSGALCEGEHKRKRGEAQPHTSASLMRLVPYESESFLK
jgi:hypothetical protein